MNTNQKAISIDELAAQLLSEELLTAIDQVTISQIVEPELSTIDDAAVHLQVETDGPVELRKLPPKLAKAIMSLMAVVTEVSPEASDTLHPKGSNTLESRKRHRRRQRKHKT